MPLPPLVGNPAAYTNSVRQYEETDYALPDLWDDVHQVLINNDAYLKGRVDALEALNIGPRVVALETWRTSHSNAAVLDHPDNSVTANKLFSTAITDKLGYTPVSKLGDTMSGALNLNGGGNSLNMQPGAADHTYIAFFPRTVAPTTRGAFVGFPAATSVALTLFNEISGGTIDLTTTGGAVRINGNTVWHAGNDGVGSGIDTDFIRGLAPGAASGVATLTAGSRLVQDVRDLSVNTQHLIDSSVTAAKLSSSAISDKLGFSPLPAATRLNWNTVATLPNVVGMLAWKNFGNGHTIFDASSGTAPDATAISAFNPINQWSNGYPTLMGWNGTDTYGVRVDTSRNAENLGGQLPAFYTAITARLGFTPVNKAGDAMTGVLTLPTISNGASLEMASGYSIGSGNTATEGFNVYRAGTSNQANFGHRFLVNGVNRFELRGNATATLNATLTVGDGGQALALMPGTADHTYLAFFPRTASPTTRGAFVGFAGATSINFVLVNEFSGGNINLSTTGGVAQVNGNTIWDAGNFNPSSYLTTAAASSVYAPLAGNPNFTGLPTISSNRIVDRSSFVDASFASGIIGASATVTGSVAVGAAAVGDHVMINPTTLNGNLLCQAWVAVAGDIKYVIMNTGGASASSQTINLRVLKRGW